LKREIKVLSDIVKKLKLNLGKNLDEEKNKKDILDIKRRLSAFRNSGLGEDVTYETINL